MPEADAKVSVFDHGLLYGDGIFEGIRFYNGRVFNWKNTWNGCGIPPLDLSRDPDGPDEMTEALLGDHPQNGLNEGYIRLVVTRGVGNLGLNPVSM